MTDKRTKQELADTLAKAERDLDKARDRIASESCDAYNAKKELETVKHEMAATQKLAGVLERRIETAKTVLAAYAAIKHPGRTVYNYDPCKATDDTAEEDFLLAKFLFNTLS